jgi:ribonuclease P protein component
VDKHDARLCRGPRAAGGTLGNAERLDKLIRSAPRPHGRPAAPAERSNRDFAMSLRRWERVLNARDFKEVFRRGRCYRDPAMRFHVLKGRREAARVGLVVSRKVGPAVVRNRVKRWLRMLFQELKSVVPPGVDVVLVVNPDPGAPTLKGYREAFRRFLSWCEKQRAFERAAERTARDR